MILSSEDKVADVNQPQIPFEVKDSWQRNMGHGDYEGVEKVVVGGSLDSPDVYHRVTRYGNVTWEDGEFNRIDNSEIGTKLELVLESAYREKHFEGTK